jgi:hypothetical protein
MLTEFFPDSSHIQVLAYDDQSQELQVGFLNGRTYLYRGVPVQAWSDLLAARSAGEALARIIQRGGYQYLEI